MKLGDFFESDRTLITISYLGDHQFHCVTFPIRYWQSTSAIIDFWEKKASFRL